MFPAKLHLQLKSNHKMTFWKVQTIYIRLYIVHRMQKCTPYKSGYDVLRAKCTPYNSGSKDALSSQNEPFSTHYHKWTSKCESYKYTFKTCTPYKPGITIPSGKCTLYKSGHSVPSGQVIQVLVDAFFRPQCSF